LKATLPVLGNLLLEASEFPAPGGRLTLRATDLEIGYQTTLKVRARGEGSICVPARRLLDIVQALPEASVRFKCLPEGAAEVTCDRARFKLVAMRPGQFPALPSPPPPQAQFSIGVADLARQLQYTTCCVSGEESRYTLNGSLLMVGPSLVRMVATDGHRLGVIEQAVGISGCEREQSLLLPSALLRELRRLLELNEEEGGRIQVGEDDAHLFFTLGDRLLLGRKLTGQFPNWEAVMPKELTKAVKTDAGGLALSLKRVALVADERSKAVKLEIAPGQLTLTAASRELGDATDTVIAEYAGEPFEIGFNYQYLLDFLALSRGSQVLLSFKDGQSAALFQAVPDPEKPAPWTYRYVIMPMRV
jgi:DNA polymerase-3 subunit beta